ncbi:MAG: hypothetical protein OXP66_16900 [Candidatus Tectomicrobia bacterium]|nr:hypothetical protein [Candidatus Tectomicrobia bacterium]
MARRYCFMWFLALGLAAMLTDFQGFVVQAGTITTGTAITLGGLDSFANTIQTYMKGNLGKMIGMIIAIAGIAGMAFQKMGMGLCALGAGIAIAFVPNIIGTAFDTTAAATLTPAAPLVPLLFAGGGLLNLLGQVFLVLLWPLMLALKFVRDPVVWVALGMVALMRPALALGLVSWQVVRLKAVTRRWVAA